MLISISSLIAMPFLLNSRIRITEDVMGIGSYEEIPLREYILTCSLQAAGLIVIAYIIFTLFIKSTKSKHLN